MQSVLKVLQRELRGRFGRLPVWPPGCTMALGDVGRLDANGWVKVTTLHDLGIAAETDAPGTPADLDLTSQRGVTLTQRVTANAVVGDALLQAKFSVSGAFVLKANAVVSTRLTGLDDLERRIQTTPLWQKDWSVITELSVGGPCCVLVAGESSAEADLKLAAGVTLPVGLSARMSFTNKRGMAAAWITEQPAPVMMRAHYLRSSLLSGGGLADRGPGGSEPVADSQGGRLVEVYDLADVHPSA